MPKATNVDVELETLIRARYPIIYITSWEERRVEETLRDICQKRGKKMLLWTFTTGMAGNLASKDPLAALDFVVNAPDQSVFVLKDFHPFINDVAVTRRLRDLVVLLKTSYKTLIILSPILKLPPELEKEITVVDYQLPTLGDLDRLLEGIVQSVRANNQIQTQMTPLEREQVLKAASGLTSNEAENVFARSLVEKRKFDVDVILSEKEQIIRKSGILEYYAATEAFADVGGMDLLKGWMSQRTASFTEEARKFGLPEPKGILLLGVQGCGKSLIAKSIASLWRLPLLRMDVGKIFSGIVGSSEENMRKAISTAESVSPAILWIDELEKGFAGTQSSPFSDGGTTSRVFGTFIQWMQDKQAATFVIATSNDVTQLPPELMRKGRFDEIFFVDLPGLEERAEIFSIHLRKRGRKLEQFDLQALAKRAAGYSGAEIEQVVVSALFHAFGDSHRELTDEDMMAALRESVPLSVTMKEGIDKLRDWAATRARPASSVSVEPMDTWEEVKEQQAAQKERDKFAAEVRKGNNPFASSGGGGFNTQNAAGAAAPKSPFEIESDDSNGAAPTGGINEISARLEADEKRISALEAKTSTGMETLMGETQNLDRLDAPHRIPAVEAAGTAPQNPASDGTTAAPEAEGADS